MHAFRIDNAFTLHRARSIDIPRIRRMQQRSLRVLGRPFYTQEVIEAFLQSLDTMDDAVVAEGHYLLAVTASGDVVGSGGWSQAVPGYERARGTGEVAPAKSTKAIVRSVFVDPRFARRGIATAVMRTLEDDAVRHGITDLSLTATLSGLPFYGRHGWQEVERKAIPLRDGLTFGCCSMRKRLAPGNLVRAGAGDSLANAV